MLRQGGHKHLEVAGSFHFLESESAPVVKGGSPQPVGWHTVALGPHPALRLLRPDHQLTVVFTDEHLQST